jgi:hypothetical protein
MYEFSRAMYRRLSGQIDTTVCPEAHTHVLGCCEATIERLATDPHYFARPSRHLFRQIRGYFPLGAQPHVRATVEHYVTCATRAFTHVEERDVDAAGNRRVCQATTRGGSSCRRDPLADSSYCPSHQHLYGDRPGARDRSVALAA